MTLPCDHLHTLFCLPSGETFDPTGSVKRDLYGERRAAMIYSKQIKLHPMWTPEQIDQKVAQLIFTPKTRKRLILAYGHASKILRSLIQATPEFTPSQKKKLTYRIASTRLELPPPASIYEDAPDLLTKNDVFYERIGKKTRRLRVGGAFPLSVSSWFNLVFTMAHELAHSIDPCELHEARIALTPYDRLVTCLLKENPSAHSTQGAILKQCGHEDKLSEIFADWLAGQVVAQELKRYSSEFDPSQLVDAARNAVRDLCDQGTAQAEHETGSTSYLSAQSRIDALGQNPEIRSILGCAEPVQKIPSFCSFDWRPNTQ